MGQTAWLRNQWKVPNTQYKTLMLPLMLAAKQIEKMFPQDTKHTGHQSYKMEGKIINAWCLQNNTVAPFTRWAISLGTKAQKLCPGLQAVPDKFTLWTIWPKAKMSVIETLYNIPQTDIQNREKPQAIKKMEQHTTSLHIVAILCTVLSLPL